MSLYKYLEVKYLEESRGREETCCRSDFSEKSPVKTGIKKLPESESNSWKCFI